MHERTVIRRLASMGVWASILASTLASIPLAAAAQPETRSAAPIHHVVLCWLREPGDEAARRALIEASEKLADLPGVVDVAAGIPLASERPVVDDSFDVGIVFTFRDAEALAAYQVHPRHREAVETVLQPLVEKLLVYDIQPLARTTPTE